MSADDLIRGATDALFVLVFVAALLMALRERRRPVVDAALLFGALALVLLQGEGARLLGLTLPPVAGDILAALLVAMPYLLLRVVDDLVGVRRGVLAAAVAGLAGAVAGLFLTSTPLPAWLTVLIVVYFVALQLYASALLFAATRRSSGVPRQRSRAAVLGSILLGVAVLVAGLQALLGPLDAVTRLLALGSALAYYAAFAPPGLLKRAWQEPELRSFLAQVAAISPNTEPTAIAARLEESIARTSGASTARIGLWDEQRDALVRPGGVTPVDGILAEAYRGQRASLASAGNGTLVPLTDARSRAAIAAPISARGRHLGALVVELRHAPLFVQDDLTFVQLLADQAALVFDSARIYQDLAQANRRLQEATRMKSEFLANMSHELRSPLNGIIGFSELIHDGKAGEVSPKQQSYVGHILNSSRHLLQLINDVLDLAKVESGKFELQPESVDLAELVHEVTNTLQTVAEQKRIQVEADVAPDVGGVVIDRAKLKQVVYNYLSNALKFTPDDGRVRVGVRPEGPDRFRLEVADTGVGIKPEDLGRLFTEFQQLDASAAKKHQGTGLGLALTKRIVEAQGGTVGVESVYGSGSTFFAVLPRRGAEPSAAAPVAEAAAPALPAAPAGAPAVLVVEDDARDREWIVAELSRAGYAVELAATGREALARARERRFDLIALDLLLPDLLGVEVLRGIREGERNRDTPVLVITVVAERGIVDPYPIVDYLLKPVSAEELRASLARAGLLPRRTAPVLVVDDDPAARRLAEELLGGLGYASAGRADGESALRAAAEAPPLAVLLDLLMPGMDGFEFLERFRQTAGGRDVPVIIWTVKDLTAADRAFLRERAQGVVSKASGKPGDLVALLRRHVPPPSTPAGDGEHVVTVRAGVPEKKEAGRGR